MITMAIMENLIQYSKKLDIFLWMKIHSQIINQEFKRQSTVTAPANIF
jgi:hypothetical protein